MTNREFSRRIGCHHSTASRYKSGHRLPGAQLLERIHVAFGIPRKELLEAHAAGAEEFGRFLRDRVFNRDRAAA